MAKNISNIPNQSTPISQPEDTAAQTRGRHGAKEVSSTDTTAHLNKTSAKEFERQKLTSRKVTHENLDMITWLAESEQWPGVASAIQFHSNTLSELDQILISLSKQGIDELPSDIEKSIAYHFVKLYIQEKKQELTRGLI